MNPQQVALFLDCHMQTVKKIPPKELPYWKTAGGHRKYSRSDVVAYIERRTVRDRPSA